MLYSESMVPLRKSPLYRMTIARREAAIMDSAIFLVMRAAAMRNVSGKRVRIISAIKKHLPSIYTLLYIIYNYSYFAQRLQCF